MGYNRDVSFRGETTENASSGIIVINEKVNNIGPGSILAHFEATGTTDGTIEIFGGNAEDNMMVLQDFAIDSAVKNIPIKLDILVKFIRIDLTLGSITNLVYDIDGFV